ncbi:cytochrome c family protein [Flavobacterium luteum]|uniref:Cytochrome c n=1 Tax=Flavobacterium luteum TaxID=2026654 RepID=A0A7J5ADA7_9FLAO|nr:cytochrome c [Flavobacterium luteum]KAB1155571.1 cytochrome c [Flavobacterium luteum]
MKFKNIVAPILLFMIYSCASKSTFPVPVVAGVKKEVVISSIAEGKNLYENNCANCHKLYVAKEFSAEEWKPILHSMQKKAHLNDAEISSISSYINSQL